MNDETRGSGGPQQRLGVDLSISGAVGAEASTAAPARQARGMGRNAIGSLRALSLGEGTPARAQAQAQGGLGSGVGVVAGRVWRWHRERYQRVADSRRFPAYR